MTADSLIAVARRFLFVRETKGANRGLWVAFIIRFAGGKPGDAWCAAFIWLVASIVYDGHPPIARTLSTDVMLADCRARGYMVTVLRPGDLVFSMVGASKTDAHHVAICTAGLPDLETIAGNTSEDGKSDNGDRVAEHAITPDHKLYARLPEAAP